MASNLRAMASNLSIKPMAECYHFCKPFSCEGMSISVFFEPVLVAGGTAAYQRRGEHATRWVSSNRKVQQATKMCVSVCVYIYIYINTHLMGNEINRVCNHLQEAAATGRQCLLDVDLSTFA